MRFPFFRMAFLAAGSILLSACSTLPPQGIQPVTSFDLQRYSGKWYEIARLDHGFERGLSDVSASYSPNPDGSINVLNRGYDSGKAAWREALGRAKFNGVTTTASLKVSFFGPFYGGYHVIALDPAYRWAMVAGNDRSYLWILARDKQLNDRVKLQLLEQASQLGFDTNQLVWVEQRRTDS